MSLTEKEKSALNAIKELHQEDINNPYDYRKDNINREVIDMLVDDNVIKKVGYTPKDDRNRAVFRVEFEKSEDVKFEFQLRYSPNKHGEFNIVAHFVSQDFWLKDAFDELEVITLSPELKRFLVQFFSSNGSIIDINIPYLITSKTISDIDKNILVEIRDSYMKNISVLEQF